MRALSIILTCLAGPMGGLPVGSSANSAGQPIERCCCCPDRTVCRCGCDVPVGDRSPSSPQEPRRLYCSCDSAPLGPLPAGYRTPTPRVIETLPADNFADASEPTRACREASVFAHGPPPDLPFLRTIVLIA